MRHLQNTVHILWQPAPQHIDFIDVYIRSLFKQCSLNV